MVLIGDLQNESNNFARQKHVESDENFISNNKKKAGKETSKSLNFGRKFKKQNITFLLYKNKMPRIKSKDKKIKNDAL